MGYVKRWIFLINLMLKQNNAPKDRNMYFVSTLVYYFVYVRTYSSNKKLKGYCRHLLMIILVKQILKAYVDEWSYFVFFPIGHTCGIFSRRVDNY